jgi:hypothetical protein
MRNAGDSRVHAALRSFPTNHQVPASQPVGPPAVVAPAGLAFRYAQWPDSSISPLLRRPNRRGPSWPFDGPSPSEKRALPSPNFHHPRFPSRVHLPLLPRTSAIIWGRSGPRRSIEVDFFLGFLFEFGPCQVRAHFRNPQPFLLAQCSSSPPTLPKQGHRPDFSSSVPTPSLPFRPRLFFRHRRLPSSIHRTRRSRGPRPRPSKARPFRLDFPCSIAPSRPFFLPPGRPCARVANLFITPATYRRRSFSPTRPREEELAHFSRCFCSRQ